MWRSMLSCLSSPPCGEWRESAGWIRHGASQSTWIWEHLGGPYEKYMEVLIMCIYIYDIYALCIYICDYNYIVYIYIYAWTHHYIFIWICKFKNDRLYIRFPLSCRLIPSILVRFFRCCVPTIYPTQFFSPYYSWSHQKVPIVEIITTYLLYITHSMGYVLLYSIIVIDDT